MPSVFILVPRRRIALLDPRETHIHACRDAKHPTRSKGPAEVLPHSAASVGAAS